MQSGDELGPFRFQVTREQLVRYAGASDDYNPIHYDDALAQSLGLPGIIVHGMLNMGLIARYVMAALPEGTQLEQYGVRFRQMVQPGQDLMVTARVREADAAAARLDVQLAVEGGKPAVMGKMTVRFPGALG
ncbi:MAG: MaoC family dehydratase N-terminal domain-containing protein [Firmicutes bacterium]|nr:MaoC family dehydratase N-terminal domain-containing protein [Bacillota bacterium]